MWLPCPKVKKGEIFDGVNWLLCNSEKGLGVWALNQSAARALTQKYERAVFQYILDNPNLFKPCVVVVAEFFLTYFNFRRLRGFSPARRSPSICSAGRK